MTEEALTVGTLPPDFAKCQEEGRMFTLADALQLGTHIEYLRQIATKDSNVQKDAVINIIERIDRIFQTRNIESEVGSQVNNLKQELEEEESGALPEEETDRLEKKAITWNHLINQDLQRKKRIPVSQTGLLDVDRLVDSPESLFSGPVWDWLDERPKSDIREACRTIVIGCPTSSVMLSLRAVEHCLREWYEQGNQQLDEAAWGQVLDRLMEEYVEEEKKNDTVLTQLSDLPPVLSTLYHLKEKRNEVNHPEKSPNEQEARRTLMIVASTITEIFEEIRDEIATEIAEEGEYISDDRQMTLTGRKTEVHGGTDPHTLFYSGIRRLEKMNNGTAPVSLIFDFGQTMGFDEEEVDNILRDLLMDGRIYEPSDEEIKSI